jgi:hypothetical protein
MSDCGWAATGTERLTDLLPAAALTSPSDPAASGAVGRLAHSLAIQVSGAASEAGALASGGASGDGGDHDYHDAADPPGHVLRGNWWQWERQAALQSQRCSSRRSWSWWRWGL